MINLHFHGRPTAARLKLLDGLKPAGANVVQRQKGFSDFNIIQRLIEAGWMECRQGGPRGGRRWYTTPAGAAALSEWPRA